MANSKKRIEATDSIYCGYENYQRCKEELVKAFPSAVIEDTSDGVHGGMFQITVPDVGDELGVFLIKNGYFNMSLYLGLCCAADPERLKSLMVKALGQEAADQIMRGVVEAHELVKQTERSKR